MSTVGYIYDAFISHSPADRGWVREWLLPHLEAAGVRTCVDYRDFAIGAPVLENRTRAVEQSRHTLLVISPDWLSSELNEFEALLAQSADPAARERRMLPLMLRHCEPSSRITILDYADFTNPAEQEEQLKRLLGLLARDIAPRQHITLSQARRTARAPFILPQLDITSFTGRTDELKTLERLLLEPGGQRVCSIVGLAGTGGIGKSALACHFAQQYQAHFPDGVVGIRVDGKDIDTLAREFAHPYETIEADDDRDAATIMQQVFKERQALLIFDNANDAIIRKLRPGGDMCAVIVTTRDRLLPRLLDIPLAGRIDLPALSNADAHELLDRLLSPGRAAAEPEAAHRILTLVGNLPLAIQIVGAALEFQPGRSLESYADAISLARLQVPNDEHLNVRAALIPSLALLKDQAIVDFFACLSVCAQDGFAMRTAMAAGDVNEDDAYERLALLYRMSLLNYTDASQQRFVLHPLIRMFADEIATERGLRAAAAQRHAQLFIALLKASDTDDPRVVAAIAEDLDDIVLAAEWLLQQGIADYEYIIQLQPFFEQHGHWFTATTLMAAFLTLAEHNSDWSAIAQFRIQQAKYLTLRGEWAAAETTLEPINSIIQRIEFPYHQQRTEAMWLTTLSGLCQRQGRIDEAIGLLQRGAQIEEHIGNIRGLAKVLNSLGGLFQRQGHFDQAASTFQQSAAIEAKLGNTHGQAKVLNSLGSVLQRQGHFERAAAAFRESYQLLTILGDKRGQAMVLTSLSTVLQHQGHFDDAIEVLQQSAQLEHQLGNLRGQAMVLTSLGGVLQRQGHFAQAIDVLQQSAKIEQQLRNLHGQAIVLNSLGGVFQRQGHFDKAVAAFERSLAISERLGDERSIAMVLNSLGGVLQRQGRFAEAIVAFKRSISIAEEINDQHSIAIRLNSLGGVFQRQGRFAEAIDIFQKSITIGDQLRDERHCAMALNSLGGVLQRQGRFAEAIVAFERSQAISEQLGDARSIAMVLNSLGGVLQRQGRFDEAITAFEHSLKISERLKNDVTVAMVLNSLGGVLQRQGRYDDAIAAFQRSLEISERLKNDVGIAMVLNSLGGVLQRQGRFDNAIDTFKQSYQLLVTLGDERGQAMVLNSMGGALHHQRHFDAAIEAFERSIAIGKQLGDQRHLAMVYTSLGNTLLAHGDTERAIAELTQGFTIDEGLGNRRGIGFVAPPLIHTLLQQGRTTEAQAICQRALVLAPHNRDLLDLHTQMHNALTTVYGTVKRILSHPKGYLYGFIMLSDGTDIYFHERDVVPALRPMPHAGAAVACEIKQLPNGVRQACNVRLHS